MRPHDAVFLALAALAVAGRPRLWWVPALAPLAAAALLPLGALAPPLAALAACVAAPAGLAPAAILLAVPVYAGWAEAARSALLWLGAAALLGGMEERFEEVSPRLRGAPIRLFAAGVLYYALLPVSYV